MDHRRGRSQWKRSRHLGNRCAFAPDPNWKSASLSVPLRPGNRRAHLFRRFPLMVLFVIFCPIVAAILIMIGAPARKMAVAASVLTLGATLLLLASFSPEQHDFQEVTSFPISSEWNLSFTTGIDGLSLALVLLAAIVTVAAVWFAGKIDKYQNSFYACLLFISGGAIGAFASLDLFFFYAFHELALIPTFLLIGIWGGGNRVAAAWKITIYLAIGSFILLLGLILLYQSVPTASRSFDIRALKAAASLGQISGDSQRHIYLLLLIGFGILTSLFPFHTWAPEAYAAAPAPAAMLHAGILKKFGLYGLLRLAIPLLPEGARHWTNLLVLLLLGNIIYVGLVTIAQKRLDWMLGYSSVMHIGYIFLGIASASILGVTGAVVLMFAHGLSIALLFALAGELRKRTGTLVFEELGGLAKVMPFAGLAIGRRAALLRIFSPILCANDHACLSHLSHREQIIVITAPLLEVGVLVLGMVILMFEAFATKIDKRILAFAAIAGLAIVLVATFFVAPVPSPNQATGFWNFYTADRLSVFFKQFALLTTILVLIMMIDYAPAVRSSFPGAHDGLGEFFTVPIFTCAGLMYLVSAIDFIFIFVSLELVTISFYVLVSFTRKNPVTLEAGVKYLVLSALSTAFLVYGIAWIFGVTGQTNLQRITEALATPSTDQSATLLGMVLVLVALGFKIAAVPFQIWVPDVYQGAPTPVTAYLSVGSKAAGFVVLLRVLRPFATLPQMQRLLVLIALLTLIYGNLAALPQGNLKRLLAYSSIAHTGYLLIGVVG